MKAFTIATFMASALAAANAFEVSFPNSNGGYWVSNHTNTLNWKANSTDAPYFSVQLLNSNSTILNGNFQIGNAITSSNGTAQLFILNIPAGTYSLLFVNSSNYQLDHPQVFYTLSSFEIKPNGTEPAAVTANQNADPNSSATTAATGSASATLSGSTASPTGQHHNSASNMHFGVGALAGTLTTLVLGLGLAFAA